MIEFDNSQIKWLKPKKDIECKIIDFKKSVEKIKKKKIKRKTKWMINMIDRKSTRLNSSHYS